MYSKSTPSRRNGSKATAYGGGSLLPYAEEEAQAYEYQDESGALCWGRQMCCLPVELTCVYYFDHRRIKWTLYIQQTVNSKGCS